MTAVVAEPTVDFSKMSNPEIEAYLANRRKELATLNQLAADRGISKNAQRKAGTLTRSYEAVGRAERVLKQAEERLAAARQTRTDQVQNYLTAKKVEALPAEIQAEVDQAYEAALAGPPPKAGQAEAGAPTHGEGGAASPDDVGGDEAVAAK